MVKNRIEMRVRGRGMTERPGKEVGLSDRHWMGEGVPLFYSKRVTYCKLPDIMF